MRAEVELLADIDAGNASNLANALMSGLTEEARTRLGIVSSSAWRRWPKGTTCFVCVSRPAHALISASGEKKKTKKFKENPYLWTSSRGQILSSTVADKETDCSTQKTALWRLMEKVNLLVSKLFLAVDSIALQNESRSRRSRLPGVSLLLEHGSS